jgi:hypothetical protein
MRALSIQNSECSSADMLERELGERVEFAFDDLTLCHGLGGLALTLVALGRRATADALGHAALSRYGASGACPCGALGTTPALFRGTSGIGWLFLVLSDVNVPSPLMVDTPG